MDRFRIARVLRDIATLLALSGGERFKVRAYRTAAQALESLSEDLGAIVDEGRLEEIAGVGPKLAAQIAEIWHTGRSSLLERLASELPAASLELAGVPGLTLRRLRALQAALGPLSLAEIERACVEGRVRGVPGFGAKTEQRILQGIRLHRTRQVRVIASEGERLAEIAAAQLRASGAVTDVIVAGDLRRGLETVDEIVVVAVTNDASAVRAHFESVAHFELPVRLRTASPERCAATLFRATGPTDHVTAIEKRTTIDDASDENEIYARAELSYIAPELRDLGNLPAAARATEELVSVSDLRGFVHCHTEYSDGRHSIEQMAREAERLGAEFITITDHSQSAHYAGGLSLERLERQWEEIARVQELVGVRILRGIESDILADGSLDYPDAVLERFDVIIASLHSGLRMSEDEMTRRLIRTLRLPIFKIWGHALGRILLRRAPVACRVEEVLDAAAESRVAIEVNGDPHRLDLAPEWIRRAREREIPFVVSTDAHSTRQLAYVEHGVRIARRGGLSRHAVLNTLDASAFVRAVRPSA